MTESVVHLDNIGPHIIQITMEDRVHKNTFSHELMHGLVQAFELIKGNPEYKVGIITGYDTYFSSGGTKEALIGIHDGKVKFTDTNIYSLALECDIPIISAMQGHGIGGGFALGLFSDFVIMSRESVYTTNFMKYGFTPGMGSTYILTMKLGISLAHEMLLAANTYRGGELEKRGIPFPVLPRQEVLEYAYQLANDLAEKPRFSLVTLKDHLVSKLRKELPLEIEKELKMHEKTFHQPEVKERIKTLFGE
jgi:polyketide biosynthesis enoyl-CoA hydratase PksI